MPSLMATLGLNASNFNQNAEKVIAKADQVGRKISSAASGDGKTIKMSGGSGLMSDPNKFLAGLGTDEKIAKSKEARRASIAREAAEAKRADAMERDRLRTERATAAQRRRDMAQLEAEGRAHGKRNKQFNDEVRREMQPMPSILGSAVKSLAAFATLDFAISKVKEFDGQMSKLAADTNDMTDRLGMSVKTVQALDVAFTVNGTSLKENVTFFDKLAEAKDKALSGDKEAIHLLRLFGVEIEKLSSLRTEDITLSISKAFNQGGDPQRLITALRQMGGKSAGNAIKAFSSGSIEKAIGLNMGMDEKTMSSLAYHEDWKKLRERDADGSELLTAGKSIWRGTVEFTDMIFAALPNAILNKMRGGTLKEGFQHRMNQITKQHELLDAGQFSKNAIAGDYGPELQKAYAERAAREKADGERRESVETKRVKDAAAFDARVRNALKEGHEKAEEAERVHKEEVALKREAKSEVGREMAENAQIGKHSVNSLQQMGGFLGNYALANGPETAAMNAQVRSEEHLRTIIDVLKQKKAGVEPEDVEY